MRYLKKIAALVIVCAGFIGQQQVAFANDAEVKTHVETVAKRVIRVVETTQSDFKKRQEEFKQIFAEQADTQSIAKFVAGRAWGGAGEQEKNDFVKAFQDYMAFTYAKRITAYGGETLSIIRVQNMNDKGYVVRTRLNRTNDTPPLVIDWQLRSQQQAYKILDLRIEEISMSQTQRSEFQSILQRNNMKLPTLTSILYERMKG